MTSPSDFDRQAALQALATVLAQPVPYQGPPIIADPANWREWPSLLALLDECDLAVVPKVPTDEMIAAIPDEVQWWVWGEECAGSLNDHDTRRWLADVIAAAPKIESPP